MSDEAPDFLTLPDLASRQLAGSVVAANDELFAERENLVKPGPAVFDPTEFGPKGKVYDGWETRRRREPGNDWAIVRLGVPGVVAGVVVGTVAGGVAVGVVWAGIGVAMGRSFPARYVVRGPGGPKSPSVALRAHAGAARGSPPTT